MSEIRYHGGSHGRRYGKTAELAMLDDREDVAPLPPWCSADLTGEARNLLVRAGGRTLFDEVNPFLSNLNASSQLPTEHLANAYLSIHRDWHGLTYRQVVSVLLLLERANAAIVARDKEAAEAQAVRRPHPPRGKPKRTHAGGRR